jgi:hypothetical protein
MKVIEVAQVKDSEHAFQTDLKFNCLLKMQDKEDLILPAGWKYGSYIRRI